MIFQECLISPHAIFFLWFLWFSRIYTSFLAFKLLVLIWLYFELSLLWYLWAIWFLNGSGHFFSFELIFWRLSCEFQFNGLMIGVVVWIVFEVWIVVVVGIDLTQVDCWIHHLTLFRDSQRLPFDLQSYPRSRRINSIEYQIEESLF